MIPGLCEGPSLFLTDQISSPEDQNVIFLYIFHVWITVPLSATSSLLYPTTLQVIYSIRN